MSKLETANSNLNRAAKAKNDEFYTQLTDIEKELGHYSGYFKDKIVFCNCDDPKESNFFKYFALNFKHLGLKKLITTHYNEGRSSYKLEIIEDINKDGKIDLEDAIKTPLNSDGDFRSDESIKILKEADIVVTNPPFSLFREYVAQLVEYNKNFVIIGSENSITYKEIFPLIKNNNIWLGNTRPKEFVQPDKSVKKFGNICWYTNLDTTKRHEDLILYKSYNVNEHLKYDNYNAINIDKVKEIPINYKGIMGVPITFIDKYNPNQFKIVGSDYDVKCGVLPILINENWSGKLDRGYINNKRIYARIFIQKL